MKKLRRYLRLFASNTVLLIIGMAIIGYSFLFKGSNESLRLYVGIGSLVFFMGYLLTKYLNSNTAGSPLPRFEDESFESAMQRLRNLRGNSLTKHDVRAEIDSYFTERLINDEVLRKIEMTVGANLSSSATIHRLRSDFETTTTRLKAEILRLTRSANLNLVVGILTTTIAVAILGKEIYFTQLTFTEWIPLLSHYIPRITIVIFIEVFAFFFLKIYRSNLSEIKYFHNELTNVEAKLAAIKAAVSTSSAVTDDILREFASTERNFKLSPGESTIELEKEKIEIAGTKNLTDALKEVLKNKQS